MIHFKCTECNSTEFQQKIAITGFAIKHFDIYGNTSIDFSSVNDVEENNLADNDFYNNMTCLKCGCEVKGCTIE